jgi:HK97 family phage prohead protease
MFKDYPKQATENAKRAIRIKEENDRGCGTRVGWVRARQLANREAISLDTVKRMASFNRHRQNSEGDPKEDCGALMWLAWGGTAGIDWAIRISNQNKTMKFKNTAQDVRDIDEKKGIVVAYANVYDYEDSDGDISQFGSFKRTVNNNFKRIRVLKDHNSTVSLGVPLEVDANDSYGLKTTTQFNLKKEVARDMFTDIELMLDNGLSTELSIGYEIMGRDEKNKKIITEYKLFEYSFLTGWGANMLSVTEGIKSIQTTEGVLELIQKAYDMEYSDARLKQIEAILKGADDAKETQLLTKGTQDERTLSDSIEQSFVNFNIKHGVTWTLKNK